MATGFRLERGRSGNPAGGSQALAVVRHSQPKPYWQVKPKLLPAVQSIWLRMGGDVTALKLCLDRIAPVHRGDLMKVALPEETTRQVSLLP